MALDDPPETPPVVKPAGGQTGVAVGLGDSDGVGLACGVAVGLGLTEAVGDGVGDAEPGPLDC
jgi:hypothetical protein